MSIAFIWMLWLSPTTAAEMRWLSTKAKKYTRLRLKTERRTENAMEIKWDTNELVVYDHFCRVIELCADDDGQKKSNKWTANDNTTSTEAHRNGVEKCTKESRHELNAKNSFMALWWWRNVSSTIYTHTPAWWLRNRHQQPREKWRNVLRLGRRRCDTRNICDKEIKSRLHFGWCCARPVTSAICERERARSFWFACGGLTL